MDIRCDLCRAKLLFIRIQSGFVKNPVQSVHLYCSQQKWPHVHGRLGEGLSQTANFSRQLAAPAIVADIAAWLHRRARDRSSGGNSNSDAASDNERAEQTLGASRHTVALSPSCKSLECMVHCTIPVSMQNSADNQLQIDLPGLWLQVLLTIVLTGILL